MKVALCLRGQPRFFDQGMANLSWILDHYDVDIFAHFWYNKEQANQPYEASMQRNDGLNGTVPENLEKKMQDFNFESYLIEEPRTFKGLKEAMEDNPDLEGIPLSVSSQFYSIQKVNELKTLKERKELKQGFYDLVINTRTDLIYHKKPNLSAYRSQMKLFTSYFKQHPYVNHPYAMTDQFIAGDTSLVDNYAQVFDNMLNYIYNKDISPNGEPLCGYHTRGKHGIEVYPDPELDFEIIGRRR